MAKDVSFEVTEKGPAFPAVKLWINDLIAIQFDSADELEQFAKDILGMIPEIIDTQAQ